MADKHNDTENGCEELPQNETGGSSKESQAKILQLKRNKPAKKTANCD